MRHSRAKLLLDGYEPHELTIRQKMRLERHLTGCTECREVASEGRALRSVLADAGYPGPGRSGSGLATLPHEATTARILRAALQETEPGRFAWITRPSALLPATSAAILLLALLLVGREIVPGPGRAPAGAGPTPGTAAVTAPASDFSMVKTGETVTIKWPHNGRVHRIRKGDTPVTVSKAAVRLVKGGQWSDQPAPDDDPRPGSVLFYLVD